MARIRTVKPEFFRHEGLQDLEAKHPTLKPMLVFAGLWGQADKAGCFEWRPRQLKLDILPFLAFEMTETLSVLQDAGLIEHYQANGKDYGRIPTFNLHQRIEGREREAPGKHPTPTGETTATLPVVREGKGREGKGNGGPRKRGTRVPADLAFTEQHRQYAEAQGLVGPAEQFERFLDHHRAKGSEFVDWDAAWRTWVRNGVKFQAKDRGPQRRVSLRPD